MKIPPFSLSLSIAPNACLVFAKVRSRLKYCQVASFWVWSSNISKNSNHLVRSLHNTPLTDFHRKKNAKMVDFAGWCMPLQYSDMSIVDSHLHVRAACGIFDVSHMLQTRIFGAHRSQLMESLTVTDVKGLREGTGALSVLTNERGGIIDDLIISKCDEYLYVVSNASRADVDLPLLQNQAEKLRSEGKDVYVETLDNALIAVQGPSSIEVLEPLTSVDLSQLRFMSTCLSSVCGVDGCRITRCGYTGEDGVEISIAKEHVRHIVETLLQHSSVRLIGLGARDTLRLEAGLCLYGNDIDESTTPVEAGLTWTIGMERRKARDFPGAQIILDQIKNKPGRKRVALVSNGPPARAGAEIYDVDQKKKIGHVTSGCPSPSLGINIALGYVDRLYMERSHALSFKIRNKFYPGTVVKMPHVKHNYAIK